MTSAAAIILTAIQREAAAWQVKNFGEPNALLMISGCSEEFGESQEHIADTALYNDAVSDCCIYLMQFATCRGWDIGELFERRDLYELPSRPWPILLGRIHHHNAKAMQGYRGPATEHDERCRAAISALLKHWDKHLSSIGHDFIAVVEKTWREVAARDWTPETKAGEATLFGGEGLATSEELYGKREPLERRVFEGMVGEAGPCIADGRGDVTYDAHWLNAMQGKRVRLTVEELKS